MGNKQIRQEQIQNTNYVENLPSDIQCMIAERIDDYQDIMLIYELYPNLRHVLYRCVREIYVKTNEEIIWDTAFFLEWTNLQRTNILVRVQNQGEMNAIASLPNLKTHRVILDFNPVTKDIEKEIIINYNRPSAVRYIRWIQIFDDYLTLHLRNAEETEELILLPSRVYFGNIFEHIRNNFCFSYVSDYGGYIYINNTHCGKELIVDINGTPHWLYLFLLNSFIGNESPYTEDAFSPESIITKRKVPRFLSFEQVILTSNLSADQTPLFESLVNILPIRRLGILTRIDEIRNYQFYIRLLQVYPKIIEFRLFVSSIGIQSKFNRYVNIKRSVDDFPRVLESVGTISQSLSLDISPLFRFGKDEYQIFIDNIPNLTYTFYRFKLRDIVFFLKNNIPVNFVNQEVTPKEEQELVTLQEQYPHFHIIPPKYYLVPEF